MIRVNNSDIDFYKFCKTDIVYKIRLCDRETLNLQFSSKYIWKRKKVLDKIGEDIFDICFCVIFDCYCQIFIYGGEPGYWAVSLPKVDSFPIFLNILRSYVLRISATREATRTHSFSY